MAYVTWHTTHRYKGCEFYPATQQAQQQHGGQGTPEEGYCRNLDGKVDVAVAVVGIAAGEVPAVAAVGGG